MIYDSYYRQNTGKEKLLFLVGWGQVIDKKLMDILALDYEVLALSFPFQDPRLQDDYAYNIETYRQVLVRVLIELEYYPSIAIGHSFGGKILSFCPDLFKRIVLVAPSSFKPLSKERVKTRFLIYRNKIVRRLTRLLGLSTPLKYLGSDDYRRTHGLRRRTFLNIKDAYPAKDWLKTYASRISVIAFFEDQAVGIKRVEKALKDIPSIKLTKIKGNHNQIYLDRTLLLSYLRGEYED